MGFLVNSDIVCTNSRNYKSSSFVYIYSSNEKRSRVKRFVNHAPLHRVALLNLDRIDSATARDLARGEDDVAHVSREDVVVQTAHVIKDVIKGVAASKSSRRKRAVGKAKSERHNPGSTSWFVRFGFNRRLECAFALFKRFFFGELFTLAFG